MKILLLTPDLPYPSESGAALRNMGIIRGLRDAGCTTSRCLAFGLARPRCRPIRSRICAMPCIRRRCQSERERSG